MTEKLRHETKSWLSNPGNMITLVLAVISISSAIYNAAARYVRGNDRGADVDAK